MLRSREDLQNIIDEKIKDIDLNFAAKGILDMAYSKYWGHAVEQTFRSMLNTETDISYTYYDPTINNSVTIPIPAIFVKNIKEQLYPQSSQTTTSQLGNSHYYKQQRLDTPTKPQKRNQTQINRQKVFDTNFEEYTKELNEVVQSICEKEQLYVMFHSILKLIDVLEKEHTFDSYTFIKIQIQKLLSQIQFNKYTPPDDSELENELKKHAKFYAEVVRKMVESYKGKAGPNVFTFIEVLKNIVHEHSKYCDQKFTQPR
jgi:hypothetical protein